MKYDAGIQILYQFIYVSFADLIHTNRHLIEVYHKCTHPSAPIKSIRKTMISWCKFISTKYFLNSFFYCILPLFFYIFIQFTFKFFFSIDYVKIKMSKENYLPIAHPLYVKRNFAGN